MKKMNRLNSKTRRNKTITKFQILNIQKNKMSRRMKKKNKKRKMRRMRKKRTIKNLKIKNIKKNM